MKCDQREHLGGGGGGGGVNQEMRSAWPSWIQWNLCIKDTKHCPLLRGSSTGLKQVSLIERCLLFGVSFIGG